MNKNNSKKCRNYLCTIHIRNIECPYVDIPMWEACPFLKRATFQQERGEKTHKLHWQVFLELNDSYAFVTLQGYFPTLCCKLSQQFGHPNAGRNYVHKEETRVGQETFNWTADEGYLLSCQHKASQTHTCTGAPPHVLRIPRPLKPSGQETERQLLQLFYNNKINEMRAWQAFSDRVPFILE